MSAASPATKPPVRAEWNGDIVTLTISNPPLNIMTIAVLDALHAAIEAIRQERPPGARAILLRAEGKAFSAGADVAEHLPGKLQHMLHSFHRVVRSLYDVPVTTIAVVEGPALGGGCEVASMCDIVIATPRARFGQPEIRLAALAPVATCVLQALVGPRQAARLLLTGASVTAEEALAMGLVTEVAPAETLAAVLKTRLEELSGTSAEILGIAAKTARSIAFPYFTERLAAVERTYLDHVAQLPDAEEGLRAFLEKRAPLFNRGGTRSAS